MKKLAIFLISLLCFPPLFAVEPTKEQKQAVFMMNYSQYVAYKLKTYNNILALEEEYSILNNNMNFETIRDSDSVETINRLMDSIHTERKNHKARQRLKAVVERRMNDALYNSIPNITTIVTGGATPLSAALNIASTIGGIYTSYQRYKNQISEEYDEKMFELQNLTEDNLNDIYKDLNTYTFNLLKRYNISDEWRLNEQELSNIFKYLKDSDAKRAYTNLKNMSEGRYVQHFPMFWYHLARAAQNAGEEADALRYYSRFENENIEIFRYDKTAVDAYKGKIAILQKNKNANRNEIYSKLAFIEKNKTTWNDYYFCALVYAQFDDTKNAKRLLERNINELSSEVDNQFLDGSRIDEIFADTGESAGLLDGFFKKSESSTAPVETVGSIEYDGLELSRALLSEIGGKSGRTFSENSIERQYASDTQSTNEALYYFGQVTSSSIAEKYKADAKRVLVSTKVPSEKKYRVDVMIPLQWMLSANSELKAVFWSEKANDFIFIPMKIDERASKKQRKSQKTSPKETLICYTTGDFNLEWKKDGMFFDSIILIHSAYPIEFQYSVNISKQVKELAPNAIYFNKKKYAL